MTQELQAAWLPTKLGALFIIGNDLGLYLVKFADSPNLEHDIEQLRTQLAVKITPGTNNAIEEIKKELQLYFAGLLTIFQTPIHLLGSEFQTVVWQELTRIPYGKTQTYASQAIAIGKPQAYRAVAQANSANKLAIIIPCHRVISSHGNLGGYNAGKLRKKWLIEHEKKHLQ